MGNLQLSDFHHGVDYPVSMRTITVLHLLLSILFHSLTNYMVLTVLCRVYAVRSEVI